MPATLWPMVLLLGIILLTLSIRAIAAAPQYVFVLTFIRRVCNDCLTLKLISRSVKLFFRKLFVPKSRINPAHVHGANVSYHFCRHSKLMRFLSSFFYFRLLCAVVMLLIAAVFVASCIIRGVNRNFPPAAPVGTPPTLDVMSYNVFQVRLRVIFFVCRVLYCSLFACFYRWYLSNNACDL